MAEAQPRHTSTNSESEDVKTRSARLRPLAVLPVLLLGCLGLVGCDSKAGTAAVVDGHRITEKELSRYLPANAKPIEAGDGSSSTPAKTFVLQYLVRNQVFPLLLAASGSPVTDAQLEAGRAAALTGTTEAELTDQITKAGLSARFEPVLLRNRELLNLLRAKLTTDKQIDDALAKIKNKVSLNPRYGSWDERSLSLQGLSSKQLPSVLSVDTALPGDAQPTQQ
ncbi:hypothetical protein [Jatrophihabitans sp.]|uniref:hypothetical protein n=1 Tax=Jatrophihabitans sp. TaxID=1932789 RepID=UPI002C4775B9|nr:hypothetical protein [Jatrophihabitans sp.]